MALFKTGVVLEGRPDGAVRAFKAGSDAADRLRNSTDRAGKSAAALSNAYGIVAGKISSLVKAGAALGTLLGAGVLRETIAQDDALAQLNATLRSTRGAAGLTADELTRLASGLQSVTRFGDDAIIGAESLLLTFTKIGKDVFPNALETVLDMSTALKQDLQSSAVQLGKALQDPILGVTALRRVGVNFSADQQLVIKRLVETGRAADAQRLILRELQTEFGGSARAARDTLGGALVGLRNAFGDLFEATEPEIEETKRSLEGLTTLLQSPETAAAAGKLTGALIDGFAGVTKVLTKVPEFAEILGIQIGYLMEAARINFGLGVNAIERGLAGLKLSAATIFDDLLDSIAEHLASLAGIADRLPFGDAVARQLDAAANGVARFGAEAKRSASDRVDALEKERAALLLAGALNEQVRSDSIALMIDSRHAAEDLAVATGSAGRAAGQFGEEVEGAAPKVDKLAEANRKLLDSLRANALSESEMALAQYEKRIAELQQLLDAGLIGEAEFGDLAERFKSQYWDKVVDDAQDAKQQLAAVDPFGGMRDTLVELSTDWGRATANIVSGIQTIQKANSGMFGATAKGWGQVAAGASQYFDEGSGGYKVLQAASQAFYTFEIAQQAASAIASLTASNTKATGHATAAAAAGAEAVATQASAGPYVGFALAAAMVAFLASMGISPKGKGGGSAAAPRGNINKGTGSVLGDANAQSESIANSLEQLESLQEDGLGVSMQMLLTLRSIDAGVRNTAAGLARNVYLSGNVSGAAVGDLGFKPALTGSSLNYAGALVGGVGFLEAELDNIFSDSFQEFGDLMRSFDIGGQLLSGLLGNLGSFKQIKDQGLLVSGAQTLAQVITDGLLANFYTTIRTGQNDIFGGDHNVTMRDVLSPLTDGIQSSFDQIVIGLGDAAIQAAEMLGITEQDVMAALAEVSLSELGLNKISFNKLTGDELEEAVGAVFSSLGDAMAEAILPSIIEFQRNGEGAFETLVRVASQTAYTTDALDALGVSIAVVGDPLGAARAADALATLAGGFDKLQDGLGAFVDLALTDAEKLEQLRGGLTGLFADFDLQLPDTTAGVLDLVRGLDLTTEAGQEAFTAIIGATDALAAFYDELKRIERAAYEVDTALGLNDGLGEMRDALSQVGLSLEQVTAAAQQFGVEGLQALLGGLSDANKAVLQPIIGDLLQQVLGYSSVGDYEDARANAARAASDEAATRMRDAVRGVLQFADGLKASIVDLNGPEQSLQQLRSAFSGALINASSDNRNTRIAGLTDIATLGPDLEAAIIANASSAVDAQRQLAKLRADSLAAAYDTLDVDEQQLNAIHGVQGTIAKSIDSARENSRQQVQAINHVSSVLNAQSQERRANTESNDRLQLKIDALNRNVEMLRFEMQATAKNTAKSAKVLSRAMQDGESLNVKTPS